MENSQKTLLIVSILTILVIISGSLFIYFRYIKDNDTIDQDNIETNDSNNTAIGEDWKLDTQYLGENTWEYKIIGTLPNTCYDYSIEPIVLESYPEQVHINVSIDEISDICIQVIQEIDETGTFNASEEAIIDLLIGKIGTP
jgi:hypothetical protein